MTQQAVVAPAPAAAPPAPVVAAAPASEGGEPTMEELAASMADPEAAAPVAPVVEAEAADAKDAEPAAEAEPAAPSEADAALERATKAAAKAREGSRRYKETQQRLAETNAIAERHAREAEQSRQELAAARQREAAYKQDPYKALKDAGMTDVQLAERAMRENTPEAIVQKLQEELAQERSERRAYEQRMAEQAAEAREQAARQQRTAEFVSVADDEATFPRLSQLDADVQLTMARDVVRRCAAKGIDVKRLSHEQVAEECERLLTPKRAPTSAAAPTPRPAVTKPSGKTLTNAAAQTRTVAPADWDSLTEEQQMAHMAAGLTPIG